MRQVSSAMQPIQRQVRSSNATQAHWHGTCTGKPTHMQTQARNATDTHTSIGTQLAQAHPLSPSNLRRQAHLHRHTSYLSACSFTQSSPLTPTHTHAYTLIPNTFVWTTTQLRLAGQSNMIMMMLVWHPHNMHTTIHSVCLSLTVPF